MKHLNVIALAGIVGALVFTGCEKAPQVEIDKAKQAVSSAAAEASVYAADKMAAAQSALDSAMAAVKAEDSKLFKNFTVAKAKLADATKAAEDAVAAAAQNKEAMKTEVTSLVGQAKTALEAVKKEALKAKKKSTETVKTLVSDGEKALAAAEAAINGNDLAGAKTSAQSALEKATQAKTDLEATAKPAKVSKPVKASKKR